MRNYKIIIFGILVALLMSATMEAMSQKKPKKIDFSTFQDSLAFSELFENISYIPLETNENCFLTYPTQIEIVDSLIFFQDHRDRQIFVFDILGHYSNRIGRIGGGPGEALEYGDFLLNKNDRKIEVCDSGRDKLLIYNYNGTFIDKRDLMWSCSFNRTVNGDYLLYSAYAPHFHDLKSQLLNTPLILVNKKGKIINRFKSDFKPFGLGATGNMEKTAITDYGDTLILCANRSNIIYQYSDKRLEPRYYLDFGKRNLPQKYYKTDGLSRQQIQNWKKAYIFHVHNFFENENCCLFGFAYRTANYRGFFSNKGGYAKAAIRENIHNDIDGIKHNYLNFKGVYKNYMISYIAANHFKENVSALLGSLSPKEQEEYIVKHPDVIRIFKTINEDDNPIIILYKCKDE